LRTFLRRCGDHAKIVLLDTLGVILAGHERPEVAGAARAAGAEFG
jgi:hypothetical protein